MHTSVPTALATPAPTWASPSQPLPAFPPPFLTPATSRAVAPTVGTLLTERKSINGMLALPSTTVVAAVCTSPTTAELPTTIALPTFLTHSPSVPSPSPIQVRMLTVSTGEPKAKAATTLSVPPSSPPALISLPATIADSTIPTVFLLEAYPLTMAASTNRGHGRPVRANSPSPHRATTNGLFSGATMAV